MCARAGQTPAVCRGKRVFFFVVFFFSTHMTSCPNQGLSRLLSERHAWLPLWADTSALRMRVMERPRPEAWWRIWGCNCERIRKKVTPLMEKDYRGGGGVALLWRCMCLTHGEGGWTSSVCLSHMSEMQNLQEHKDFFFNVATKRKKKKPRWHVQSTTWSEKKRVSLIFPSWHAAINMSNV